MTDNKTLAISEEQFWEYSLSFYTQKNNQEKLLWLQDEHSVNVNMVLLLLYLWKKNGSLLAEHISLINQKNQTLDSLTSKTRKTRRALKVQTLSQGCHDYKSDEYKKLVAEELELEKCQQQLIIRLGKQFFKPNEQTSSEPSAPLTIVEALVHLCQHSCSAIDEEVISILDGLAKQLPSLITPYGVSPGG